MSWAKFAIEALKRGETVQIRPRGHINGWVGHNCIYGKATKVER